MDALEQDLEKLELAGQQRGELQLLQILLQRVHRRRQLALELGIGPLFVQQLVERARVIHLALQRVMEVDFGLQPRELRRDLPRPGGIVPERRLGCLSFEIVELGALAVDVKELLRGQDPLGDLRETFRVIAHRIGIVTAVARGR